MKGSGCRWTTKYSLGSMRAENAPVLLATPRADPRPIRILGRRESGIAEGWGSASRARPTLHLHADPRSPDTSGCRTTLETSRAYGPSATAAHRYAAFAVGNDFVWSERSTGFETHELLHEINLDCFPGSALLHLELVGNHGASLYRAPGPQRTPNVVGDLRCGDDEGVVHALSRQQPYRVA